MICMHVRAGSWFRPSTNFNISLLAEGFGTTTSVVSCISADLGGRVGWLPKAERVKTLFLSTAPKCGGGWGGGGGVGGVRSSRFSRHPRLRQPPTRRFAKNREVWAVVFVGKRPQAPGGPGPKPWGPGPQAPWRPGPQAPGAWIPPSGPFQSLAASRIPKMPRCSSAHEKPGLLHRLISCAVPAA